MEWMLMPLQRYADFQGRSRRKEYWMFLLGVFIAAIILGIIEGVLGLSGMVGGVYGPLTTLLLLGIINVVAIAQGMFATPPIQQIVIFLYRQITRPGREALTESLVFIEAPTGKSQQSAGGDALSQGRHELLAIFRAGDVMDHTKEHHQRIVPLLRRLQDDIAQR